MRVGIVIVTYNAEAFIERTLKAVAAQTRPPDEVIVADNASTDGTLGVIAACARDWTAPLRVLRSPTNLGFAAANNRAVAALTRCDLVALLNPDAVPEPGWLAALLAAATAYPDAGSFASRLMIDGQPDILDGAGDVCHVSGLIWRHGHGQRLSAVPDAMQSRPAFSACAAAALYRRTDWERVGGFDERFFCYAEDVDLGFRLQLIGRGCQYVPDAVVSHLGSASVGVGSDFSVYHGHRNLVWMFVKDMPTALLWRYLPLHLAAALVGLLWFVRQGKGRVYVRAKRDALLGLPVVWGARRDIQRSRARRAVEVRVRLNRDSLWRRITGARH